MDVIFKSEEISGKASVQAIEYSFLGGKYSKIVNISKLSNFSLCSDVAIFKVLEVVAISFGDSKFPKEPIGITFKGDLIDDACDSLFSIFIDEWKEDSLNSRSIDFYWSF